VHEYVLEREDFAALLSDLGADLVGEEFLEEVLKGGFLAFVEHDLLHFLADLLDLG